MIIVESTTFKFFSISCWQTNKVRKINLNERKTFGSYQKQASNSLDSNYFSVGSQASSECASDLNSAMGMNHDWTDESSTVFNMNHVKISQHIRPWIRGLIMQGTFFFCSDGYPDSVSFL